MRRMSIEVVPQLLEISLNSLAYLACLWKPSVKHLRDSLGVFPKILQKFQGLDQDSKYGSRLLCVCIK